jgi:hypothetical protein
MSLKEEVRGIGKRERGEYISIWPNHIQTLPAPVHILHQFSALSASVG